MTLQRHPFARFISLAAAFAATVAASSPLTAADSPNPDKQRQLIRVLESDAPPAEKAITCKQLAIYGGKDAVAVLAPLLANKDLASWARIALEAIPDPAVDLALREALGKLEGRLLIGVINSMGVRRDAQAAEALVAKLKASDPEVVSAAAAALGRIGGEAPAKALEAALASAPAAARAEVAEGCILCAERFLREGQTDRALGLYDRVRQADVPKQKVLEGIRGAILARQSAGVPLLVEQLRSPDKDNFGIGLRTARELPGRAVTEALVAELERSAPERQPLLVMALADHADATALPALTKLAGNGPKPARLAAVRALETAGDVTSIPVLLAAATADDADLARAGKSALTRLPGQGVDADLASRLPQASGKPRQVLIELAALRRLDSTMPAIVRSIEDADPGVRAAAVGTLGALGSDKEVGDLVKLLPKASAAERGDIEKALLAIGGRQGSSCLPHLLPLARNDDPALRRLALRALSTVGGPNALTAVEAAVDDPDEQVQDEAVRTLSVWANNWPEDAAVAEPLLRLARSGKKESHQVLGLRGYLQYVGGDPKLKDADKVARVNDVLTLLKSPEDKRSAISVVSAVPNGAALEWLTGFAADPAIAEDAYAAIVNLAARDNLKDAPRALREKSLGMVAEKTKNDRTRKRAEDLLKGLK